MQSDQKRELNEAVEELYHVFKPYPRLEHIQGCPCCTTEEDQRLLHSAPLHDLGPAELEQFSFKALTTWGEVSDFKHFLPRILELTVDGDVGSTDIEVVFGKLEYAHWREWPAREQKAVESFFKAFWQEVLARAPGRPSVEDYLCAIGCATDVKPYLELWRKDMTIASIINLCEFVSDNGNYVQTKQRLTNAFWPQEAVRQIILWLESPELGQAIESAFYRYQSLPEAGNISSLARMLEAIRIAGEARRGFHA